MNISTKKLLLVCSCILLFQIAFAQPVISSFTPISGQLSTNVAIHGSGFSSILTNNVVYFGAVKAAVAGATSNSLNVMVPPGANYEPVTVTSNNLTGYSNNPFVVTFPGGGSAFTKDLFKYKQNFHVDDKDHIGNMADGVFSDFRIIDLDGDGKADMITPDFFADSISIIRNTSSAGDVEFTPPIDLRTGEKTDALDYADVDGDGKQDIVVLGTKTIFIFKNISTPGSIQFSAAIAISIPSSFDEISVDTRVHDMDGDGKPDIIICSNNSNDIYLCRNTSTSGVISYATEISFQTGFGHSKICIRDLNNDGKPDIILNYQGFSTYSIVVLENKSAVGNISFNNPVSFSIADRPTSIAVGDLDGDGMPDIAAADNQDNSISVIRNTSNAGTISFSKYKEFNLGRLPQCIAIGDINGDGKPDLAVSNNQNDGNTVSLFRNISSVGSIQFDPKVNFATAASPEGVIIADLDGDAKPEIAIYCIDAHAICVLLRCAPLAINNGPKDTATCTNGSALFTVTASNDVIYQWQADKGSGWNNLVNDGTYSGVATSNLSVNGIINSMNGYQYRCKIQNECNAVAFSLPAKLTVTNPSPLSLNITTATDTVCTETAVTFTAQSNNGGANPIYQWKKNNIAVGDNAVTYIDSNLSNGDKISCVLTSNAACLSTNTATSNDIVITVTNQITPQIAIASSLNNICFGTPVLFTSQIINGGNSPSYKWRKNGISVGSDTSAYIDSILNDGDVIECIVISGLTCSIAQVGSNKIIIKVNQLITPSISVTASDNNICPGVLINFSAITPNQNLNPSFAWEKNGIDVGMNSPLYSDSAILEGDIINCKLDLKPSSACLTSSTAISNNITMHIKNLPGPVNLGDDKFLCANSSLDITAPAGYISYKWQDNSTNQSLHLTEPGIYAVAVADACNRISTDTVFVTLTEPPSAFLSADTSICAYEIIELKANKNYKSYLWNNNATTSFINVSTPGIYSLQVTDVNNCTGSDSIIVSSKICSGDIYVPSAFTPNSDGLNDIFRAKYPFPVKQFEMIIYNRWGQKIFESSDINKGWDGNYIGKPLSQSTFVWLFSLVDANNKRTDMHGTVTLIR